MHAAKTRSALATGQVIRSFPVAPTPQNDKILLGIPLTTTPGDYAVDVSFSAEDGQERTASIDISVQPLALTASSVPPVVLLDGFQGPGCPMSSNSSGTFDNLQTYLTQPPNSNPNVVFFENCTECPNCSIEQLGAKLGSVLNSMNVSQVDVVAHSMGGLIVRSYLAGKQTSGFSPPSTQKIRKAVFISSPHFGAFATNFGLAQIFAAGTQTTEMKPGSQFVWDLGTWNQWGDDLRGVDAISLVGTGGPSGQSDGVVESTSASLDFWSLGRTRLVNYCHIPPSDYSGLAGLYLGCEEPGIAFVDTTAHPAYVAISSFLLNETAWQSVGNSPAQNTYLSKYGGLVVADIKSSNQYVVPSAVSWGTVTLAQGGASELYYNGFVSGSATFNFGASTCGPYTETAGRYSAVRCKAAPLISSVGPLLPGTARVVQAGGMITINGVGFGATQCSTCRVTAENPTATNLPVLSWSDSTITATLPSSFGVGIATIGVTAASGSDAMNVMAGLVVEPPTISLSSSSLTFSVLAGSAASGVQNITVSNSGGGSLSYSVTSNSAWLNASASGSTIAVSVNPAGLAANAYQGLITVTASGASNSPQSVSVSMIVTGMLSPTLTISSITNSGTGLQGPIAPGELFTIKGTNLGPATGTVFSVNNGTVAGTLAGTTVTVGSMAAPVLYASETQINAIAPYEISNEALAVVQVQYQGGAATQAVQLQSASPGAFTLNSTGTGGIVAANQDGTINGPNNPAAKGSYVTIYFTGGGQTNPAGVTGSVTGSVLKWLTQPISVTVGNQPAIVGFDGSAPTFVDGVDQLNIQISPNTPSGAQPIIINVGGFSSPPTVTLTVQ
jgi:uncharacterized protein (TIGR03437 family)